MSQSLSWWDRLCLRWEFRRRSLRLGQKGERIARRFLRRNGMIILAQSMRNQFGEIDLVAADQNTVVFIEVKTRSSDVAGTPAEAVDPEKQRHMTQAALSYLRRHRLLEHRARFDVVTLIWSQNQSLPTIEHIADAFSPSGDFQLFS
jgi:putative endonuclease